MIIYVPSAGGNYNPSEIHCYKSHEEIDSGRSKHCRPNKSQLEAQG